LQVAGGFSVRIQSHRRNQCQKSATYRDLVCAAGKPNENFLTPTCHEAFLGPCEESKRNIGLHVRVLQIYPGEYQHGQNFVADLDKFPDQLPNGWPYGVEIRNKHFLHPDYFAMLKQHRVAHVFNSWADMPPVRSNWPGGEPHEFGIVRRPFPAQAGRRYEDRQSCSSRTIALRSRTWRPALAGAALVKEGVEQAANGRRSSMSTIASKQTRSKTIGAMIEAGEV